MKITDAFWEKRNLGVVTQEVLLEESDSVQDMKSELTKLTSEYQVVKVPTGNIELMWELENQGFHYIETIIHVVNNLKNMELSPLLKRFDQALSYEKMQEDDIKQMFQEIKKGLFYTDRIAIDPYFTDEQASNRYVGWIRDEIERGTEVFKYVYKGKTVGFFNFKETEKDVYYPFLAGIYKEYQNSPLGMVYVYKPLLEAKQRGGKQISTYISSNNSNAMRMHVQFGFEFRDVTNVYVRHM